MRCQPCRDPAPSLNNCASVTYSINDGCQYTGTVRGNNSTIAFSIADNCPSPINVTATFTDENGNEFWTPANADFDYNTGIYFSERTYPLGVNTIIVTATDPSGNVSTCNVIVTIIDDKAPTALCQDLTIQLNDTGNASITESDIDTGSNDECGIDSLSLDQTSFDCSHVGTNTVTLTVTDNNTNTSTCTATVTVEDQIAPIAICQDVTIQLDANGQASTTPTDINNGSNDACGIGNLSLDQTDFTCDEVGDNPVTLTVTDNNGNSATCSATVLVEDNLPPTIDCFDQTIVFNGEEEISLDPADLVEATDNCELASTILDVNIINCDELGDLIPVLIEVTDENGNQSDCIATVTVDGLPCGFSQDPDGINCEDGNEVSYDPLTDVFTIKSTNCYYANPYNSDESAFVAYELCGDGEIITEVSSVAGLGWAGIQMRESTDAGAKKFSLSYNGSNFSRREVRYQTDAYAYPQQFPAFGKNWLKLVRSGNQFIGYVSTNGSFWQMVMVANITMNDCIEIGLFVTNFTAYSTVTAQFGNTTITSNAAAKPDQPNQLAKQQTITDQEFMVYPNPTRDIIYLDLSNYQGEELRVELLDLLGRPLKTVFAGSVQKAVTSIDLSDLPAGTYYLHLNGQHHKINHIQQIIRL